MKLSPKPNGKGYITSYSMNVGSKEAKDLNFINENGTSKELEKIIDIKNRRLIVFLKKD